jgi:hypothetical protein
MMRMNFVRLVGKVLPKTFFLLLQPIFGDMLEASVWFMAKLT